jgi:hypothetical protein
MSSGDLERLDFIRPASSDAGVIHSIASTKVKRYAPLWVAAVVLTAGAIAGAAGWVVSEQTQTVFRPRLFEVPQWEAIWMEPTAESRHTADSKNAALAHAILGCAAGLAMGMAGGLSAGAPARGLFVGLCAQAVGFMVGAFAALAIIPLARPVVPPVLSTVASEVWLPLLFHGGIWGAVGAVAGAAFAIGMGSRKTHPGRAIFLAAVGGILAAVLFQLLAACLPLEAGATSPVAQWPVVRLAAMLLPNVMIAAGAALGAVGPARLVLPNLRPAKRGQGTSSL